MRHRSNSHRLLVVVTAAALIIPACGDGDTTTTTGPIATTTASVETTTTASEPVATVAPTTTTVMTTTSTDTQVMGQTVYFLLEELDVDDGSPGPYLVPVHRDAPIPENALETSIRLLLEGPTADETSGVPPISTAIPEGTTLLGVVVEGATATVDLSEEFDDGGGSFGMFARLAQVVYTVTRAAEVDEVVFDIDGEVVTVFSEEGIELDGAQQRDDYYEMLPPIFLDSPAWGQPVTSPIRVRGLSNVFEAISQVMLTDDDGEPLYEDDVMATCGTGCWGEWQTEISYAVDREQFGALIVWEISAKDGSRINLREYPVLLH
ncbi:MAG: Gmad2 immunoglobulin-like domain-containing protein [Acidimicrobiia bacterium]